MEMLDAIDKSLFPFWHLKPVQTIKYSFQNELRKGVRSERKNWGGTQTELVIQGNNLLADDNLGRQIAVKVTNCMRDEMMAVFKV